MSIPTDAGLAAVLLRDRTVAVVGMSANPQRPSHYVARYLQSHGYRIVPVNPRFAGDELLGETVYAALDTVPFPIDMVDVFRRTEEVPAIAASAISVGAKTLWQQIGVLSATAHSRAIEAGLDSVMNRCTKIEHARLLGESSS